MPSVLPVLEKTWEYATNIPIIGTQNAGQSQANMMLRAFQLLEDVYPGSHYYNTGQISEVTPGSVYAFDPLTVGLDPAIVGNLVGSTLLIRGATTPANNGDFTVTQQEDMGGGNWRLRYNHSGGVQEVLPGSAKCIGMNGFSFPWYTSFTHYRGVGAAAVDDGVDRVTILDETLDWTTNNTRPVVTR